MPSRGYVKLSKFSNKMLTNVIIQLQSMILFHTSQWKLRYSTKIASPFFKRCRFTLTSLWLWILHFLMLRCELLNPPCFWESENDLAKSAQGVTCSAFLPETMVPGKKGEGERDKTIWLLPLVELLWFISGYTLPHYYLVLDRLRKLTWTKTWPIYFISSPLYFFTKQVKWPCSSFFLKKVTWPIFFALLPSLHLFLFSSKTKHSINDSSLHWQLTFPLSGELK